MNNTLNCINLENREDRLLSISKQAKAQGYPVKFWEGIRDKVIHRGVSAAHRQIILDAKENGYVAVTVCEDDIIFSSPYSLGYYFSQTPKDFDIFLGMVYQGVVENGVLVSGFSGLTLYTVHSRFYDTFLNVNPKEHIDRELGKLCAEKKYYVCEPFVCYQSGGYSDNKRQEMNYSVYHDKMKFYGR